MRTSYLTDQFDTALRYDRYVQTGTDEQQRRWRQVYDAAHLTEAQKVLVRGFVRQMKMLAFSGIWCGDCVEQCPLMQRIAEVNPERIDLRFIERSRDGELDASPLFEDRYLPLLRTLLHHCKASMVQRGGIRLYRRL